MQQSQVIVVEITDKHVNGISAILGQMVVQFRYKVCI